MYTPHYDKHYHDKKGKEVESFQLKLLSHAYGEEINLSLLFERRTLLIMKIYIEILVHTLKPAFCRLFIFSTLCLGRT